MFYIEDGGIKSDMGKNLKFVPLLLFVKKPFHQHNEYDIFSRSQDVGALTYIFVYRMEIFSLK